LDEVAWYFGNCGGQARGVALKRANRFGLYDMLGNVWEWVSDWYGRTYYQGSPSQDPSGATSGQYRVLRGGSCIDFPRFVGASHRTGYSPGVGYIHVGVRCVREVVP